MIEKASNHWNTVIDHMSRLWPQQFEKRMNTDINRVLKARIGRYPLQFVLQAMDNHLAESKFFPLPVELIRRTQAILKERNTEKEQYQPESNIEHEEYVRTRNLTMREIETKHQLRHKASVCKQNVSIGKLFGHLSVSGEMWQNVIYYRIKKGLKPDDTDNERITKKQHEPAGDIEL